MIPQSVCSGSVLVGAPLTNPSRSDLIDENRRCHRHGWGIASSHFSRHGPSVCHCSTYLQEVSVRRKSGPDFPVSVEEVRRTWAICRVSHLDTAKTLFNQGEDIRLSTAFFFDPLVHIKYVRRRSPQGRGREGGGRNFEAKISSFRRVQFRRTFNCAVESWGGGAGDISNTGNFLPSLPPCSLLIF